VQVAARVIEEESEAKLKRAGADIVYAPDAMASHRLSQSLLRPHVKDFIDFTTGNAIGLDVRIEQVLVPGRSGFVAQSLRDTPIRRELGLIVLAIRRANGEMVFNPQGRVRAGRRGLLDRARPPAQLRRLEEACWGVQARLKYSPPPRCGPLTRGPSRPGLPELRARWRRTRRTGWWRCSSASSRRSASSAL
jgi:hypothetical protein